MSSSTINSNAINETAAREYAKLAGFIAGAVIVVSIPLSIAGAFIASALGYDAALVGGSIVTLAILGAALVGIDALRLARWMMVEQIASHLARHDAEAAKHNAEAAAIKERGHAEAERILAEADAIELSAQRAAQLNLNTGPGNMKVSNKPVQYNVAGHAVGQLNLNQINQTETRKIEIPAHDLVWIHEQLANGYGHSKGDWKVNAKKKDRIRLPYSGLSVDYEIYKEVICDPLAEAEPPAIVGRGDRASGELVTREPAELMKALEQKYPGASSKGIVLELPALASSGN